MSDGAKVESTETVPEAANRADAIEVIGRTLDECRARIDELVVQLDLAKLDARDEVAQRLSAAQNAYLAARSELSHARTDLSASVDSLRQTLEKLLHDIGQAYAGVRRGRKAPVARLETSISHGWDVWP